MSNQIKVNNPVTSYNSPISCSVSENAGFNMKGKTRIFLLQQLRADFTINIFLDENIKTYCMKLFFDTYKNTFVGDEGRDI